MKVVLMLLFISGFSYGQSPNQARDYKSIRLLVRAASDLSWSDLSCNQHRDCGSLPIGAKACGGPQGYLLVSRNNRNFEEVRYLASRSEVREHDYNTRYRIISDCTVVQPPRSLCVRGTCH